MEITAWFLACGKQVPPQSRKSERRTTIGLHRSNTRKAIIIEPHIHDVARLVIPEALPHSEIAINDPAINRNETGHFMTRFNELLAAAVNIGCAAADRTVCEADGIVAFGGKISDVLHAG
ncbi:MAG: hypothetical protein J0I29_12835 [Rhizobiales bacterium]|nr:hypothetical protein [Hyphomicrobiales bacterium]